MKIAQPFENLLLKRQLDSSREKILRGVKARDSYGQVLDTVQLAQAVKQQDARTQPDIPMIMENGNLILNNFITILFALTNLLII